MNEQGELRVVGQSPIAFNGRSTIALWAWVCVCVSLSVWVWVFVCVCVLVCVCLGVCLCGCVCVCVVGMWLLVCVCLCESMWLVMCWYIGPNAPRLSFDIVGSTGNIDRLFWKIDRYNVQGQRIIREDQRMRWLWNDYSREEDYGMLFDLCTCFFLIIRILYSTFLYRYSWHLDPSC